VAAALPDLSLATRLWGGATLEGAAVTLGEIARRFGASYEQRHRGQLRDEEFRALRSIAACRTALCGWRRYLCKACGRRSTAYNSCGNRDCPGCQHGKRAAWLAARRRQLLPVPYFHLIVPLPGELSRWALFNRQLIFELLFAQVQATLQEVARRQCGLTEIGYLAVLHTWGQRLQHHVHLHLIVAGGGITESGQWKTLSEKFFLPVEVLRTVFRAKMLQALLEAYEAGQLNCAGPFSRLADWGTFCQFYGQLLEKEWVMHVKPPVHGDPDIVLKYLTRYVYRVGISNSRLLQLEGDQVTLSYQDYAEEGSPEKQLQVSAEQLLGLFLQHVSPKGFKRIRYVGFWSGPRASQRIAAIREQLTRAAACHEREDASLHEDARGAVARDATEQNLPAQTATAEPAPCVRAAPTCPHCGSTDLQPLEMRDRYECRGMWANPWDAFPAWQRTTADTS
jgi:hypothetical protein